MKPGLKFYPLIFLLSIGIAKAQNFKWWDPAKDKGMIEGQAWSKEAALPYDRLPRRLEGKVPERVWQLSRQSAGLMVRFITNSPIISLRYQTTGASLNNMADMGVKGIDLYTLDANGKLLWCFARPVFGDTITYDFKNLDPNDGYHKGGREYRLYLPLYDQVKWLEIGTADSSAITPLQPRPDHPIVVYGTSIAQGASASRPGMAWPAILGRKLDRPLINLGFSGNGKLDKGIVDLLPEIDAKVFILDNLPNLTRIDEMPNDEIKRRITYAVKSLKQKRPETPILMAAHAGYTDDQTNAPRKETYERLNVVFGEVFDSLVTAGVGGLYMIPKEDFGQDIETMVDGTHPSDLGMMRYAEAYENHLRRILREPSGKAGTVFPVIENRGYSSYDWQQRHIEILNEVKKDPPQTVFLGNSITQQWGGKPAFSKPQNDKSWKRAFGNNALNLGYGWDRIENVLWRVYHGELDGYEARNVLVHIGTNNLEISNDEEIMEGWSLLIQAIKGRQPKARIIISGIYPREKLETRLENLNNRLKEMCESLNVEYQNVGSVFLLPDGKIDPKLFLDGLHPNEAGYEKLADAWANVLRSPVQNANAK